jgi:4-amino-4-deoxy-L-arabinose transferase-like glycosyltransferase
LSSRTSTHGYRLAAPAATQHATGLAQGWPFLAALLVIAALTAGRVAYLAGDAALELAPDEAHYWDWSRRLDWSYYSKGPLVAWLIRLSCTLLGGDTMFAVRLPAVLCGALTLLGIYFLTLNAYGKPRLALLTVALSLALPLFHVGALLMTIDAPYVCAWTWALVIAQHAIQKDRGAVDAAARRVSVPTRLVPTRLAPTRLVPTRLVPTRFWPWLLLGLVVGLGILAKYTMILFIPSLACFCLLSREHRGWFRRPGPYFMTLVAGLCCFPIVIWNVQHGWVTLHHVGGQAGLAAGEFAHEACRINWFGPLEYLGGQFALLMAFGFIIYFAALARSLKAASRKPQAEITRNELFLTTMSLAMFLTFLAFSFTTKVQLNWPIAAYLSALPLCVKWIVDQWQRLEALKGRLFRGVTALAMLAGLAISLVMHHTEWLYPLLAPLSERISARRWDPTFRLRGWSALAKEVQQARAALRKEGVEPIVCGTHWNLPGAIAFYLPDQPTVYGLGALAGDRRSQYDFWPPHPAHQPEAFAGKTFIIVGYPPPEIWKRFERVEPTKTVVHKVHGQPIANWGLTVARGFRAP